MRNLFSNVLEGATVGGVIGAALDVLTVGGATLVAGPVGFAVAATAVASKAAVGTLVGAGAGVAKTVKEDIEEKYYG